jgi:amino acid transporter
VHVLEPLVAKAHAPPGYGVLVALGEMSTKYPSKKGFAGHATRCVDPAFGFATALVYLCKVSAHARLSHTRQALTAQYLIISPNQIVAGSLVMRYWNQSINGAAWVTIFIAFVRVLRSSWPLVAS